MYFDSNPQAWVNSGMGRRKWVEYGSLYMRLQFTLRMQELEIIFSKSYRDSGTKRGGGYV